MQRIPRAHNKKINQLKKQQCRYTMPNKHRKRHHQSLGKCKWTPQRQQDMPVAKARTEAERQRRQQGRSQRRPGRGGRWAHRGCGGEGVLGSHACAPGWRGPRHRGGLRRLRGGTGRAEAAPQCQASPPAGEASALLSQSAHSKATPAPGVCLLVYVSVCACVCVMSVCMYASVSVCVRVCV